MKKVMSTILLALLLFTLTATPALAVDPPQVYSSIPTEGTPAKGVVGSAEGHKQFSVAAAGVELYSWRNNITLISSGYVMCSQRTITDLLADKIQVDFVLQQWNGSSWVTYSTSENWILNSDIFSSEIYRYVAHGYNYRIKTTHKAWLDLSYDSAVLYSSYIYVP